jgi:hypothetical protein
MSERDDAVPLLGTPMDSSAAIAAVSDEEAHVVPLQPPLRQSSFVAALPQRRLSAAVSSRDSAPPDAAGATAGLQPQGAQELVAFPRAVPLPRQSLPPLQLQVRDAVSSVTPVAASARTTRTARSNSTVRLVVEDWHAQRDAASAAAAAAAVSVTQAPIAASAGGEAAKSAQSAAAVAKAAASTAAALQVELVVDPVTTTVADVVRLYRQRTRRRLLLDPVVFLAHAATAATAAASTPDAVATAAVPAAASASQPQTLEETMGVSAKGEALLQRMRGKRVALSPTECKRTLAALGVAPAPAGGNSGSSVLTLRARPFPLHFEVDNRSLLAAGVPSHELDWHRTTLWLEERHTVAQMRREYVRQVRENWNILGCDRHRFFVEQPPERKDDEDDDEAAAAQLQRRQERLVKAAALEAGSSRPTVHNNAPSDALEVTWDGDRLLNSLGGLRPHGTVWVRKDPSRWLGAAVRRGDTAEDLLLTKKLIELGADAHLRDSRGFSAFHYAQTVLPELPRLLLNPRMLQLLCRAFPPSPLERSAVRSLQRRYEGWLLAGHCVRKGTYHLVRPGDLRHYHDYAFVQTSAVGLDPLRAALTGLTSRTSASAPDKSLMSGAAASSSSSSSSSSHASPSASFDPGATPHLRLITNELSKPVGVIDLSGDGKSSSSSDASVAPEQDERLSRALHSGMDERVVSELPRPARPSFWPEYDATPAWLLFDVHVKQAEEADANLLPLRWPQFPSPSEAGARVFEVQSVPRYRRLITWVDTFNAAYLINIKLLVALLTAAAALSSLLLGNQAEADQGMEEYNKLLQPELAASVALTGAKGVLGLLFLVRICWRQGKTLSFPRLKRLLLTPGAAGAFAYLEAYVLFLLMEMCDAAAVLCHVRQLAALSAQGVSVTLDDVDPRSDTILSKPQAAWLNIFVNLLLLVCVNVVSVAVGLAADESPSMMLKLERYVGCHFLVLVQCFSALRLVFDLREMAVLSGDVGTPASGVLAMLTPVSLSFLLSYLGALSLKTLQKQFHPPMNHRLADEQLAAVAIQTDRKASVIYVLLAIIVYAALQHPASAAESAMLAAQHASSVFFSLAESLYFASAMALLVTALLPLTLAALDKEVQWVPPFVRKAWAQWRATRREASAAVAQAQVAHAAHGADAVPSSPVGSDATVAAPVVVGSSVGVTAAEERERHARELSVIEAVHASTQRVVNPLPLDKAAAHASHLPAEADGGGGLNASSSFFPRRRPAATAAAGGTFVAVARHSITSKQLLTTHRASIQAANGTNGDAAAASSVSLAAHPLSPDADAVQ